jgi:hypothetical protein
MSLNEVKEGIFCGVWEDLFVSYGWGGFFIKVFGRFFVSVLKSFFCERFFVSVLKSFFVESFATVDFRYNTNFIWPRRGVLISAVDCIKFLGFDQLFLQWGFKESEKSFVMNLKEYFVRVLEKMCFIKIYRTCFQ